jgi:ABC-2 type transport system permease protein
MKVPAKGMRVFKSTGQVITRITLRNSMRGAIILGVLAGAMVLLQGTAYVAAYPDIRAQQGLADTLLANPSLGILYGDPSYAATPRGYVVYRCLAFLMLVASIWGVLTATRLFRGQEEDGRLEMLLSGQTTSGRAAIHTLSGFVWAWGIAFAMCALLVIITGQTKDMHVSAQQSLFFTFTIFLPALFFIALGAFTSQLAASRRRATLYALIPLVVFYVLRCIAHVLEDAEWVRVLTPFGWAERAEPIINSKPLWLLPIMAGVVLFAGFAIWIASKRDLGDSVIAESDVAKPRYAFLKNVRGLAVRLHSPVMFSWLLGTVALAALMTSLAKTAADAVRESGSVGDALSNLTGGSAGAALAFMSMGTFFTAIFMMLMSANGMGAIRHEEAKSYLDNMLSRPVARLQWLRDRLVVLIGGLLVTYAAAGLITWLLASNQGIVIDGPEFLLNGLNIFGATSIVLGFGILLFGWKPRFTSAAMYIAVGWSFLIDMIGSVVTFDKIIANSSLLHHIALVPATKPDWSTFWCTLAIGAVLAVIGMIGFVRRDLEVE